MRIGILTLPFNNNYGGYLQAFALQKALIDRGHEAIIIDRRWRRHSAKYRAKLIVRGAVKSVLHLRPYPVFNVEAHKGKMMRQFVDRMMNLSPPLYSTSELSKYCYDHGFDAIVVGSDQIWRPEYVPDVEELFLKFLGPNTRRGSYAASFGISNPVYSEEQIKSCGKALESFDYIGVRENTALDVFDNLGWNTANVHVNIDPTMLLTREIYIGLTHSFKNSVRYKNKMLAYILDNNPDLKKIIESAQQQSGVGIEYIIDPDRWKEEYYVLPSIEEWLSAFSDAAFIITDSFHGAVFSIIMHKDFVVYTNKERGRDRIETLLSTFGINDRMVEDAEHINVHRFKKIDWQHVDQLIKQKQSELDVLLESLS